MGYINSKQTKKYIMKMRSLSGLCIAVFLLLSSNLKSANFYVLFDETCMDRLEYKYVNLKKSQDYVVYHINVNATTKVVLEVGPEGQSPQSALPQPLLSCDNAQFDKNLVQTINSKIDQIGDVRSVIIAIEWGRV